MGVRRFFAAAAAVLVLGGCGSEPPRPAATGVVTFGPADVTFVRALLPRHQAGIVLAGVGADRASRPEVRTMAAAIVATQRDEVARMTEWLAAWKQAPASAAAGPDLAELRAAGQPAFDRRFLSLLIEQQQDAVRLAQAEEAAGSNVNARSFATEVRLSRQAQIKQLRGWASAM
jgi:uncharacterized protein (DUF305 family)